MRPRFGQAVLTDDDRERLRDRLERQAAELVDEWLEYKDAERQRQGGLLQRLFGKR